MAEIIRVLYAGKLLTRVYNKPTSGRRIINTILHGTWLGVLEDSGDGWVRAVTAGPDGWVREADTRGDIGLKMFFIDVGQGDAVLIEAPGKRILVDGGPLIHTRSYLKNWQYSYELKEGGQIKLDAVVVTHFDADHYVGITKILEDERFKIQRVYHNGIARFVKSKNDRPAEYDTDLGKTNAYGHPGAKRKILKTSFDDLADVRDLLSEGGLQPTFKRFLEAVVKAKSEGRLGSVKRLTSRSGQLSGFTDPAGLVIDVLGPVPLNPSGRITYPWFKDSSHTRNGHSVVLKLTYNQRSFLLGGDLNAASEEYLLQRYQGREDLIKSDVTKSCHHGASDFTVDFLKVISPHATVFSSGDNESYAHPRADALGASGRYGRGTCPLIFSTELARSVRKSGDILFGMINLRSDGDKIVMAQMKEKASGRNLWDAYEVPFKPKGHSLETRWSGTPKS